VTAGQQPGTGSPLGVGIADPHPGNGSPLAAGTGDPGPETASRLGATDGPDPVTGGPLPRTGGGTSFPLRRGQGWGRSFPVRP
jgi:hypothetical protein